MATSRIARSGRQLFFNNWFSQLPLLCLFVWLLWPGATVANDSSTQLRSDTEISTAGYYQLSWVHGDAASNGLTFRLVEIVTDSNGEQRRVIYHGRDTSRIVSGKPDGEYQYRVLVFAGNQSLDQSNPVVVTVRHHSLDKAFGFFIVGVLVFIAIVIAIFTGTRRAK